MLQNAGSQLLTASGAVGTASKPTRVFSIHIISSGATVDVALRNGGSGSTIYVDEYGTSGKGVTFNYGSPGFMFPAGCYATLGANVTSAYITYAQEMS